MNKLVITIIVIAVFSSCLRNKEENEKKEEAATSGYSVGDKKVTVYTTGDSGSYRLSLSDSSLQFKDLGQPNGKAAEVTVLPHSISTLLF